MSITESLHEALWHLRKPDEDRVLWVDALCIDQTNIKERGHQVSRMGEIYKKADKVIVWLGYLSGNATKLKSAITMLEAQVAELPGISRKWPREDPQWKSQWRQVEASLGPFCRDGLVDGLKSFMQKPWFSRVWVLQEVANAKNAIVTCNLGEVQGWIFALLPHAMDVEVTEQCQAVLDIMPHPSTPSTSRKQTRNLCNLLWKFRGCKATDPRDRVYALLGMATDMKDNAIQPDYAREEQVVMKDLYAYIVGGEWPVHDSPASNIRDLQQKLPDVSRQKLEQMLESTPPTDLLEQFLCRQGLITKIDNEYLLYLIQHGSSIMEMFLDKSKSLPQVSLDVGLVCLQRFPDVFEILLRRPDCTIDDMSKFAARAMEYRPQLFERLAKLSSDPEQFRHDALLQAIPRGLPTCQALLDNCKSSVKITKEMLRKAIFFHRDILQILLEEAQSPIEIFEDLFLEATPKGFQILDDSGKPIVITKELIGEGIMAGPDILQLYLVTMESTIELEEDLFIKAIKKGLGTLECMLTSCTKPFNITKIVYVQAVEAGVEILSYLYPESFSKLGITESHVAASIVESCKPHEERQLSDLTFFGLLRGLANDKLQVTDNLIALAMTENSSRIFQTLFELRERERDISEEMAIRAIKRGPEAFTALFNKKGTNFRVTKRIREVASEHSYAFEVLRVKRQSEVFPRSFHLNKCVLPAQMNEVRTSESQNIFA